LIFLVGCGGGISDEDATALQDRIDQLESDATSTTTTVQPTTTTEPLPTLSLFNETAEAFNDNSFEGRYFEGNNEGVVIQISELDAAAYALLNDGSLFDRVETLLEHLEFNSAVMERVLRTRALDGTQTASSSIADASWTYHPDAGLNLVIEATVPTAPEGTQGPPDLLASGPGESIVDGAQDGVEEAIGNLGTGVRTIECANGRTVTLSARDTTPDETACGGAVESSSPRPLTDVAQIRANLEARNVSMSEETDTEIRDAADDICNLLSLAVALDETDGVVDEIKRELASAFDGGLGASVVFVDASVPVICPEHEGLLNS